MLNQRRTTRKKPITLNFIQNSTLQRYIFKLKRPIKIMKPFCEIIVADILPALRALVANELVQSYGFSQFEASRKLGMTQPAISHYRRRLRGGKLKLLQSNERVAGPIKNLAAEIASGKLEFAELHGKICGICRNVRKEGIVCKLHGDAYSSLRSCNICLE